MYDLRRDEQGGYTVPIYKSFACTAGYLLLQQHHVVIYTYLNKCDERDRMAMRRNKLHFSNQSLQFLSCNSYFVRIQWKWKLFLNEFSGKKKVKMKNHPGFNFLLHIFAHMLFFIYTIFFVFAFPLLCVCICELISLILNFPNFLK